MIFEITSPDGGVYLEICPTLNAAAANTTNEFTAKRRFMAILQTLVVNARHDTRRQATK
jgi:hypothetical protein